jgi:carbamoyl-phosphate synthase large subunit
LEPQLFSYETAERVPVAQVATVLPGKLWDDPELAQDVARIVGRHQIHLIVPCVNRAALLLSRWAGDLRQQGCAAVVSDEEVCSTFDNKRLTEQWFLQHGVSTPLWSEQSPLPWLLKPIFGAASRGHIRIESRDDFARLRGSLDMNDYVLQPIVKGVEYTVDGYVSRSGEILGCVTRSRLAVADGEVVRSQTERVQELVRQSEALLRQGKFCGPITLQAIQAEGEFWFLEINPRLGGGVILSIAAGADYPRLCVREALGRAVAPVSWREGLLMTRAYREVFFEKGKL